MENDGLKVLVRPRNIFVTRSQDRYDLTQFLYLVLGNSGGEIGGYLCLCNVADIKQKRGFQERFVYWNGYLAWLDLFGDIFDFAEEHKTQDCYFSPMLFSEKHRRKELCLPGHVLWSDLDNCHPSLLSYYGEPEPNILVRTSPERYHGYWLLDRELLPAQIEQLNHRIAVGYKDKGIDQSGWDLTQLLRLPTCTNNKAQPFVVMVEIRDTAPARPGQFDGLPQVQSQSGRELGISFDEQLPVIEVGKLPIGDDIKQLIVTPPERGERSEACFKVIAALHKVGLTPTEIKAVMKQNPIGRRYYE